MKQHKFSDNLEESYTTLIRVMVQAASEGLDGGVGQLDALEEEVGALLDKESFSIKATVAGMAKGKMVPIYSFEEAFFYNLYGVFSKHLTNLSSKLNPPLEGDSFEGMKKGLNNLVNLVVQDLVQKGQIEVKSKVTIDSVAAQRTIKDYFIAIFRTAKDLLHGIRNKEFGFGEVKDKIASSFSKNMTAILAERGGKVGYCIPR